VENNSKFKIKHLKLLHWFAFSSMDESSLTFIDKINEAIE